MTSMLVSGQVGRGFDPRSGQTKNYKNRYVLLLHYSYITKKYKQKLVGSE
jgi:hypothetical protein